MSKNKSPKRELAGIAEDLRGWILKEVEAGRRRVDLDPAIWQDFGTAAAPTAPATASATTARRPAAPPSEIKRPTPPPAPSSPAPAPAIESATAPVDVDAARTALDEIAGRIAGCTKCPLHKTRHRTVPGQGHPRPDLMFIGEGPGTDEDLQGLAFVGRAGQLLTRLITAMGLTRDEVFIGNIVKCRPTENYEMKKDRPPTEDEMAACIGYLERQIDVLKPKVIVALGGTAVRGLLGLTGITRLRGNWKNYRGVPLMPTYHPSYLLRGGGEGNALFWDVWDDMVQVLKFLGKPVPQKKRPAGK